MEHRVGRRAWRAGHLIVWLYQSDWTVFVSKHSDRRRSPTAKDHLKLLVEGKSFLSPHCCHCTAVTALLSLHHTAGAHTWSTRHGTAGALVGSTRHGRQQERWWVAYCTAGSRSAGGEHTAWRAGN